MKNSHTRGNKQNMHPFAVLPKLLLCALILTAIMHATFAENFAEITQKTPQQRQIHH